MAAFHPLTWSSPLHLMVTLPFPYPFFSCYFPKKSNMVSKLCMSVAIPKLKSCSFFIMWTIQFSKIYIHVRKVGTIPSWTAPLASLCDNFTIKMYEDFLLSFWMIVYNVGKSVIFQVQWMIILSYFTRKLDSAVQFENTTIF